MQYNKTILNTHNINLRDESKSPPLPVHPKSVFGFFPVKSDAIPISCKGQKNQGGSACSVLLESSGLKPFIYGNVIPRNIVENVHT